MINLQKSESINLSKAAPGMVRVRAGLGWDTKADLDVSVFGCKQVNGAPKLVNEDYFVYFNHKSARDGSIVHSGDNTTGAGSGDDETIKIDLSRLDSSTDEVSIVVTIYEAEERKQNFGIVKGAYIKIYNDETGDVLAQYSLTEDFIPQTAVQVGSFFKNNGEWTFQAVGAGYIKTLNDFVGIYQ
jgi:tellurium resistance protein TerD